MRVVALEEHFSVPALVQRIDKGAISRRGFTARKTAPGRANPMELLPEIGEIRLKSMDEAGVTMQVLSAGGPTRRALPVLPRCRWQAPRPAQMSCAAA